MNEAHSVVALNWRLAVVRRALLLPVVLAATAMPACKNNNNLDDDDFKKVTASSTTDATEPLVDVDYRFRLDWPGEGWKLMRENEIRKLSPDSVAGAMNARARTYGAVIVEQTNSTDLEGMAELIIENRALEEQEVGPIHATTLAGKRAVRFELTGRQLGRTLFMETIVCFHHDHAYQLTAWSTVGRSTSSFDEFFESFSLTEGKVVGRTAPSITTAHGVGWRVAEGTFESAISGFRVRPAYGFRLVVGEELALSNPDAEVGWARSSPIDVAGDVAFVLTSHDSPSDTYLERIRQDFLVSREVTRAGTTKAAKIGNTNVRFDLARSSDRVETSVFHGVFAMNEMIVEMTFWSLAGDDEALWEAVVEAIETIEIMTPEQTHALGGELRSARDPQNVVTATTSLRNGAFRDFAGGWSWNRPPGFWRLRTGEAARAVDADASLYLEEPLLGVYGSIASATAHGASLDDFHRSVLAEVGSSPERIMRRTIAGADARSSVVYFDADDSETATSQYTTTITRGDRAVIVSLWGEEDNIKPDELVSLVDRVTLLETPIMPTETHATEFRDVRMGYSLNLPGASWKHRDETPAPMADVGSVSTWRRGRKAISIISVNAMSIDQDAKWFAEFIEQLFRDAFRGLRQGPRIDTFLAGRPARLVTWGSGPFQLRIFITSRDRTFYALMLTGGAPHIDVEAAFALID